MKHRLINADCFDYINNSSETWTTIFADPPDNIGLAYGKYKDKIPNEQYVDLLHTWLHLFSQKANTVWFSYNAKWTFEVGRIVVDMLKYSEERTIYPPQRLEAKSCVQTFTFGQYNQLDLGNNHRPLLRLRWPGATLYPDAIRVQSWRQEHGDKRADPKGRVPGDVIHSHCEETEHAKLCEKDVQRIYLSSEQSVDLARHYGVTDTVINDIRNGQTWQHVTMNLSDVFNFPRVTGNSKQRRFWHPTQLNEGLVKQCIKLTTREGDTVLDPFAGTGTVLRVCKNIGIECTSIEIDPAYCSKIAEEHGLTIETLL